MSPISLHRRLNRQLLTGTAALLVIFGAALGWLFVSDLAQEFDRSLESKAWAIAGVSEEEMSGFARFSNITLPDGRKGRQVVIDFEPRQFASGGSSPSSITTVIASEPRSILFSKIVRYSLTLFGFFGFLLLAQALLVRNALRRGLEPIIGLRRQLEILDPEHRGQRVSLQAPPEELAPILQRINHLLDLADRAMPTRRTVTR